MRRIALVIRTGDETLTRPSKTLVDHEDLQGSYVNITPDVTPQYPAGMPPATTRPQPPDRPSVIAEKRTGSAVAKSGNGLFHALPASSAPGTTLVPDAVSGWPFSSRVIVACFTMPPRALWTMSQFLLSRGQTQRLTCAPSATSPPDTSHSISTNGFSLSAIPAKCVASFRPQPRRKERTRQCHAPDTRRRGTPRTCRLICRRIPLWPPSRPAALARLSPGTTAAAEAPPAGPAASLSTRCKSRGSR